MSGKPGLAVFSAGANNPGINAAIRAVVRRGRHNFTPFGVERGYEGLSDNLIKRLTSHDVSGKMGKGGSFLDSSSAGKELESFDFGKVVKNLKSKKIENIVVVGGNKELKSSQLLSGAGFKVIGIPSTIQDDVPGTDICLGVDSAVNTIIQNIELIKSSGSSRNHLFLIEVAGDHSGHLAIRAAGGAGAELVLSSHNSTDDLNSIAQKMMEGDHKHYVTLISPSWKPGKAALREFLKGKGIDEHIRETTLGYIQRGGHPTGFDRLLGTKFGDGAVQALEDGLTEHMVGYVKNKVVNVPFSEVIGKTKDYNPLHLDVLSLN